MLTRVTLENFFSFGKATTIELNPGVNLLIGINASGKSNFLKALELLQVIAISGDLEDLVWTQWGGLENVLNTTGGEKQEFKLEYEFVDDEGTIVIYKLAIKAIASGNSNMQIGTATEELYVVKDESEVTQEHKVLSAFGYAELANMRIGEYGYVTARRTTELKFSNRIMYREVPPSSKSSLDKYFYYALNLLSYNDFDLSKNGTIRQASSFGFDKHLLPSGNNINTIINHIKNNHSLKYDQLEEYLRKVNPQFKDVSFNVFGSMMYLGLREKNLAKSVPVQHISDGTLYYLLLLAICCNPDRGSAIAFDEPEQGLHPDMIKTIAMAIKEASKKTQFFIATHSPLFVNHFEVEELIIFEKDQENQTIVKTVEDLGEFDEDRPTGQLWLSGYLGGKRW